MTTYTPGQGLPLREPQDTMRGDTTDNVRIHMNELAQATSSELDVADAKNDEQDGRLGGVEDVASDAQSRVEKIEPVGTLDVEDSVWRHATEDGDLLPLGYRADGHLDSHARRIFKDDVAGAEDVPTQQTYARLVTTEDGDLLLGIRWDGTVEIPRARLGNPGEIAPPYSDVPYDERSSVMPVDADTSTISLWGSSTMQYFGQDAISGLANDLGTAGWNLAKGAETIQHTTARLGSAPALVRFPDDTIPGSGTTPVTVSAFSLQSESLRPYTVLLGGISGELRPNGNGGMEFERNNSGGTIGLPGPVEATPVLGRRRRNDMTLLNLGKNNLTDTEDWTDLVINETWEALRYLAPLRKRALVLTHFVDTGTPASSTTRSRINEVNNTYRQMFGPLVVDLDEWVTSQAFWDDTGLTPTQADLDEQALGNKPHTGSRDDMHLDADGNAGLRVLITRKLADLGWY